MLPCNFLSIYIQASFLLIVDKIRNENLVHVHIVNSWLFNFTEVTAVTHVFSKQTSHRMTVPVDVNTYKALQMYKGKNWYG